MNLLDRLWFWLERRGPTGQRGERIAARYLRQKGYRILGRNLRSRLGEIDLLAQAPKPDQRTIVIVEVKSGVVDVPATAAGMAADAKGSAPSSRWARPEQHVDINKQRKLTALAGELIRRRGLGDRPVRFDVVAVELRPTGDPVIRHHPSAFQAAW